MDAVGEMQQIRWQQAECPHCGGDSPAKEGEQSRENEQK